MMAKFIDSDCKTLRLGIDQLAKSVSQVVKESYGKHTYEEFIETIKTELK